MELTRAQEQRIQQARERLMGELGMEKKASFGAAMKSALPGALVTTLVGSAMLSGSNLANKAVDTVVRAAQKKIAFKKLMAVEPGLKEYDQVKVQRNFNTLYNFAPDMAKDPNVASSFIKNTMEYDVLDHRTIVDLARATESLAKSRKNEGGYFVAATPGSISIPDDPSVSLAQSKKLEDYRAKLRAEDAAKSHTRAKELLAYKEGLRTKKRY